MLFFFSFGSAITILILLSIVAWKSLASLSLSKLFSTLWPQWSFLKEDYGTWKDYLALNSSVALSYPQEKNKLLSGALWCYLFTSQSFSHPFSIYILSSHIKLLKVSWKYVTSCLDSGPHFLSPKYSYTECLSPSSHKYVHYNCLSFKSDFSLNGPFFRKHFLIVHLSGWVKYTYSTFYYSFHGTYLPNWNSPFLVS